MTSPYVLLGKTLFVPKMTDKALGLMDFVQVFNPDDLHALPAGLWGIREPEREYMGRVRPTGECRPAHIPSGGPRSSRSTANRLHI